MKALSVQQPWAWAIFNGKPVENRTWPTGYRGQLGVFDVPDEVFGAELLR